LPKQKRENASIITQEEQTSQEIIEKIAETSSPDQQEENNIITQELTQESALEENLTQSSPYKTIATILLVLIIGVLAYKTPRKRLLKKEPKKKTIEDEIEQELRRI
jgi:predicted RND superfamily exporter protein